jgi:hypothetical protein
MSIWWYGKNKDGTRTVTSISVPYSLVAVFLACIVLIFAPTIFLEKPTDDIFKNVFFVGTGFVLFLISKLLQYKNGIWNSWGMKNMSLFGKLLYIFGYLFMAFGAINILLTM